MAHIGIMAREQIFTCTVCGASQTKWSGRCDACGAWNTIVEDVPLSTGPGKPLKRGASLALTDLATAEGAYKKTLELDAGHLGAALNLARLLRDKPAEAEPVLRASLAKHEGDAGLLNALTSTLRAQKKLDEAIREFAEDFGYDLDEEGQPLSDEAEDAATARARKRDSDSDKSDDDGDER